MSLEQRRIAVTTPTGNVGSQVTRMLLRAGVRPLLLLRDADRLDAEVRDRVDVAEGDQLDADYVASATAGVHSLFWVAPPTDWGDPLAAHEVLAANVAAAVTANGIPRVVLQSSVGAEKRRGAGDIDGLAAHEVALDATGASVVHLRCGYFFTNLLLDLDSLRAGSLNTTWPVDHPMGWVDPRDVAEVATARLLSPHWRGRVVQAVHGPRDLTHSEVAALATEVLGVSVTARQVPDSDVEDGLRAAGLSEAQVAAILGMSVGLREGFVAEQDRDVTTTTPSTLGGWLLEHLG